MFGDVVDGQMVLNGAGQIVTEEWHRIATTKPNIELDAFIVMPNHFHGIIVIHEPQPLVRATPCVARGPEGSDCRPNIPSDETIGADAPRATHGVARTDETGPSLGAIVGQIKSASSRRINRLRNSPGAPVWHRNYYDHIIRNERDLDRVREYIAGNPGNWLFDRAYRRETTHA